MFISNLANRSDKLKAGALKTPFIHQKLNESYFSTDSETNRYYFYIIRFYIFHKIILNRVSKILMDNSSSFHLF
jgi:hypothetical protein